MANCWKGKHHKPLYNTRLAANEGAVARVLNDAAFRNHFDMTVDAAEVACAVLCVIPKHVSSGEIADIKHTLPREIRELWT